MTIQSNGPWHVPGKWFVSPHYWDEAVQKEMPYRPKRVYIKDDTLREGEETPGVVFTLQDKIEIPRRLQDLGVAEIEMPQASSAKEQKTLLDAMRDEGVTIPMSYLVGGFPDWKKNVTRAVDFGAKAITLLFAFPQPHGFPTLGYPQDPGEIMDQSLAAIEYTKSQGLKVGYGAPGVTRAPLEMVVDFYKKAAKAGVERVHVYDSRGIGMSAAIRYLVQKVKEAVGGTSVLFHGHNDLGMATANTVAAVEGGAEWVDVVLNGLGDRAGNAALEEVVTILELHGISTGIKLEKLGAVSRFLEEKSGIRLQPHKAIVGTNAFLEESAAHFLITKEAEAMGAPESSLPFVPELVGRKHRVVIGTTTLYGGAIEYKLNEWGYRYTPAQLEQIRAITSKEISVKRYLSEEEFQTVCKKVLK